MRLARFPASRRCLSWARCAVDFKPVSRQSQRLSCTRFGCRTITATAAGGSDAVAATSLRVVVEPAPRASKQPVGAPLLLINGWACGADDWGAIPKLLASRGNRAVVSFDPRGIGESSAIKEPVTIETLAADAAEAMVVAGLGSRCHVLGLSLGGMVAQQLALDTLSSQRSGALELLSLSLCATSPGGARALGPPPGFLHIFDTWDKQDLAGRQQLATRFLERAVTPAWAAEHRTVLRKTAERFAAARRDGSAIAAQAEVVPRFDGGERLGRALADARGQSLPRPPAVFIVHGAEDEVFPPENARLMEHYFGDSVDREPAVFESCGHLMFLQQPLPFVKSISSFLNSVEKASP
eukprot:TRINITY_DN55127_c0_g1_i1.p1 TRINITY_DN55127_c0_g1~~TRINITY_DN55127_c0_g1_i1.p1  ORF type:complete len:372 (-),score=61.01 TRINITY_DN55127_c0_g1_i1:312-1370(-)